MHTNFKINKDGEYLGLYSSQGTEIDSVRFGEQGRDVSYGRQPDGSSYWCFFSTPTPKAPNATQCSTGFIDAPKASVNSGFYEEPITVALSTLSEEAEIYYTLDGSIPNEASPRYTDPLTIEKTQVLRARAFQEGLFPSPIATHTYLIAERVHLPILSLVTDPVNLWNDEIGIYNKGRYSIYPNYMQRGREWERPVAVEFFQNDGSPGFGLDAGIRIFGGATRESPKKSFILYFREVYGTESLNFRLFNDKNVELFRTLVVRSGGNDGEYSLTRIRDPLMHTLWAEEGGLVSASKPVFVFLNGTPWGIYNLREHIDKHYLASNLRIKDADLLKETRTVEEGDTSHWDQTLSFFGNSDLTIADNFKCAQGLIDIPGFTDFEIFQIYAGNIDLVDANWIRFRSRTPGGKWKWIMWDMDFAFALTLDNPVSHNTLAWETRDRARPDLSPPWDDGSESLYATLMLRKLLENDEYRVYFINRFADLLNTTLPPENVIAKIDALATIIEPDIPQEMARWSSEWGGTLEEWLANVQGLRDFAKQRPGFVREHIIEEFGLMGTALLTIEPPSGEGSVRVNTVLPTSYPWQGTYFRGVSVTLRAEPASGYKFAGWSDSSLPRTPTLVVSLPECYKIQAMFVPDETFMPGISK